MKTVGEENGDGEEGSQVSERANRNPRQPTLRIRRASAEADMMLVSGLVALVGVQGGWGSVGTGGVWFNSDSRSALGSHTQLTNSLYRMG